MDPNDGKKYGGQYLPQMMFGGYNGYIPGEYSQIPGASVSAMAVSPSIQPRPPYVEAQNSGMSAAQNSANKGKRRSKNETKGRDYKCTECEKTYLSYPALYTHIKTKHKNCGDIPITSVRGRGRPRKGTSKESRADSGSIFYFHTEERKGGPTAVIHGFKEAFDLVFAKSKKYRGYDEHKLYVELYKRHIENVRTCNYSREHAGLTVFGARPAGLPEAVYEPKSEEHSASRPSEPREHEGSEEQVVDEKTREENQRKKKMKKCDEIFAEYLDLIAKDVKKECYANVLKFVLIYRECMNQYGDKIQKEKNGGESNPQETRGEESKCYCLTHDAEHVPEASNELITIYLDTVNTSFGDMEPVDLTLNFCGWLFNGGYTCSKLSLMNDT